MRQSDHEYEERSFGDRCPAKADRTAVFFLRASMRQNKNISKPEMH